MIVRFLALLLFALLPSTTCLAQGAVKAVAPVAPVQGSDYDLIADAGPWQAQAGTIEVAEVFAYPCGHCAAFQPLVDAWLRKAPKDVRFVYVPAAFDPADNYARAYFAAQAMGVDKRLHQQLFDAIHRDFTLPARSASVGEVVQLAGTLGIDQARFRAAMGSAQTDQKMAAARDFAVRTGIRGTPTLIINGRYRVQGKQLPDLLRIADQLIAMERDAAR